MAQAIRKYNPNALALYGQYKKRAKKKKKVFDLTKEEFFTLTKSPCYICGEPPSQKYIHDYKRKQYTTAGAYVYNGIDRVENDGAYCMGNVLPACGHCNCAKREQSLVDFLLYVEKAYKFAIEPYTKESVREEQETSRPNKRKSKPAVARKAKRHRHSARRNVAASGDGDAS